MAYNAFSDAAFIMTTSDPIMIEHRNAIRVDSGYVLLYKYTVKETVVTNNSHVCRVPRITNKVRIGFRYLSLGNIEIKLGTTLLEFLETPVYGEGC